MKKEITQEQREALERFKARHGRTWKSELRDRWMGRNGGVGGELQTLRNTHGPGWLVKFQL